MIGECDGRYTSKSGHGHGVAAGRTCGAQPCIILYKTIYKYDDWVVEKLNPHDNDVVCSLQNIWTGTKLIYGAQ